MGVYIKMEMPQSCDDCRLNNGITCYAVPEYTEDGVVGRVDDRPDWCPLVPVPPHGDLIDRKTAYDSLLDGMVMTGYQSRALDCISDFYVPTVIPAEEGET